ncbi:protein eva-1 homolog C isoform X2 [Brienomyrus brachyistius]|uniref:protein eva-1 homolog C isoform X2 n=1 Tax=Brienomyrus brachyistius TaxID=42636 RepID=UPI0020B2164A|nr:protein eva-1 homolog C isoform X2 [Brienomyrus brachyistius]
MLARWGSVAPWHLLYPLLWLAAGAHWVEAAPDFSAYLHRILRNHTADACQGDTLSISCPPRTAIAVLSAFYGRRVPSEHLCPPPHGNTTAESVDCASAVAVQKVMHECQDQRSCSIPVNSHVFGLDPCPYTSKYLIVSYKCRPENHRSRLVCENERLRLSCKNSTVLAIYSATFGHQLHGSPHCPQQHTSTPDIECLSPSALRRVSRRCHGRTNCSIVADTQGFGDPCFPGLRKHLRVSFTCVPRYLLEDVGQGTVDPFSIADYTHGVPEKVALYFVSGICAGLIFLLCLFGLKSTLVQDVKELFSDLKDELKAPQGPIPELPEPDEDTASESSFRHLTHTYRTTEVFRPELMVRMVRIDGHEEEEELAKELPNGDIWLTQDSSPYAVHQLRAISA